MKAKVEIAEDVMENPEERVTVTTREMEEGEQLQETKILCCLERVTKVNSMLHERTKAFRRKAMVLTTPAKSPLNV